MAKVDYVQGSILDDPFGGRGFLLEHNPEEGRAVWLCHDPETNTMQKCELYDYNPVLEQNARQRSENAGKNWGDGRVVASIPNFLLYNGYYADARAAGDPEAQKKFLNDSDNKKLRTFEGRL